MKSATPLVAVVGLAAALGLAYWLQNRPQGSANGVAQQAGASVSPAGAAGGASSAAPAGQRQGAGPSAGGPGQPGGGGPVAVEVGKVTAMRLEDDAQAVGTLRSRQGVMLRPEVSGRIQALLFRDGQQVKRGQLLVQLDDTLQRAQLQQAEAQAGIARTNLQRSRELSAQGFVSQSAVDQNGAALEVAQAQVALARAQLGRMRIAAPFDGIVGIRAVNVGDYVKDGADLVNVEDLSTVWVDFRLPERYLPRLHKGQAAQIALDALPGRTYQAQIDALDSQLDANGRSVLVRARVGNGDGVLRSGMFARARVVFDVREQALVVPEEALVPLGNKQFLVKVVDGPNGAKIAQRLEAKVGIRVPGRAEILEGVQAGDQVVVAGQARLMQGNAVPVRVVDIDRPAGGPGKGGGGAAAPGGPAPGASGAGPASPPPNGNRAAPPA